MIPGPVFQFELLTTARRGRFYSLRAAYAAGLLSVFWVIHADWSTTADASLTISQMSWLAIICFCSVAVAQEILVLSLTPALVAGVIADERRRKTLHYLLISRLTGPEIVIGKLLARMLHVAVLLGVGFPILCLLVLLGGIDPTLIVVSCGAAASTAWFLAALSIWVSTIARCARDAVFVAYGLEFLWLFLPTIIGVPPTSGWPVLDWLIDSALDLWRTSTPLEHAFQSAFGLRLAGRAPLFDLVPMIACQLGAGVVLATLAALQLRAVFRAGEGSALLSRWLSRPRLARNPRRLWSRPTLGDRPMLWKERYTDRAAGLVRWIGFLVTLVAGGFLLYYTAWHGGLAFKEMWDGHSMETWDGRFRPWAAVGFPGMYRWRFLRFLKVVVPLVYIAGIVNVAAAAAASITSEHEEDTWISLTATDLTAREIILAKLLGALWRPRGIVVVILLMTLAGVVTGTIDILSFVPLCLALIVYGWFAAALGVWISLQLRSTWRAQFLTISGLLLVNLLGQAILSNVRRWAPLVWPGFTPYEISVSLISALIRTNTMEQFRAWVKTPFEINDGPVWLAIFWVLSLVCYLVGAIGLTLFSLRQFEAVAGRARRRRSPGAPGSEPTSIPWRPIAGSERIQVLDESATQYCQAEIGESPALAQPSEESGVLD